MGASDVVVVLGAKVVVVVVVVVAPTPLVSPNTSTGVWRSVVELSPNPPRELWPQHFIPPDESSAHELELPVVMAVTGLVSPETVTGVRLWVVVPSPNSPTWL